MEPRAMSSAMLAHDDAQMAATGNKPEAEVVPTSSDEFDGGNRVTAAT
jgi:hypothetical protein